MSASEVIASAWFGREIERELEVDEADLLAAPPERRADGVERLGRAGLHRVGQRRDPPPGLDLLERLHHQRMARQRLVERLEHLQRLVAVARARKLAAVGLRDAQHGRIGLVGALQTLECVTPLSGLIEDQPGMQILQQIVRLRPAELVDGVDRGLAFGRAGKGPAP